MFRKRYLPTQAVNNILKTQATVKDFVAQVLAIKSPEFQNTLK
jgi:hypothetical protein